MFAHAVPQKGLDTKLYAVERLKRDVMWLGRNRIILRSDNESAILAVLRNTLKALRIENQENTQESHPAAHDSSSNGSVEVACKSVAGMIRTMRACLEDRIKKKLPLGHCIRLALRARCMDTHHQNVWKRQDNSI